MDTKERQDVTLNTIEKNAVIAERKKAAEKTRDEVAKQFADALYTMRLGEMLQVEKQCSIQRVPGGWSFIYPAANGIGTVFVPWHDESMPSWLKVALEAGIMDDEVLVPPLENDVEFD